MNQPDANAVRSDRDLDSILVYFPEARILRARTQHDEVAVTHRAETTIYDSPEALAAAMRDHDPRAKERLAQIDASVDRARELVTLAEAREREARALHATATAADAQARALLAEVHDIRARAARFLTQLAVGGTVLAAIGLLCLAVA